MWQALILLLPLLLEYETFGLMDPNSLAASAALIPLRDAQLKPSMAPLSPPLHPSELSEAQEKSRESLAAATSMAPWLCSANEIS